MTRIAAAPLWSRLVRHAQRLARVEASRPPDAAVRPRNQLTALLARPRFQTAIVHVVAIAVSATMLGLGPAQDPREVGTWIVILVAFSALRVMTAGTSLADSSLVLEPIGVAVFLAGTGGPDSPFLGLAIAGIWWASGIANTRTAHLYRIDRISGHPKLQLATVVKAAHARRVSVLYGLSLVGGYLVLTLPQAARSGHAAAAMQDAIVMIVMTGLAEGLRHLRQSALDAKAVVRLPAPLEAMSTPVRDGLTRALRSNELAVDAILTAGRAGLTALQAELLPYLVLGLTNQEIADAIQVSEATVRYRLTRLYRALKVTGRKEAADRARELGLTASLLDLNSPRTA